jgi:hypothetical protein
LLKIANAKLLSKKAYNALIEKACYNGKNLDNLILNLPPAEEEKMKSKLMRSIMIERQRDGNYHNSNNFSESGKIGDEDYEIR